MIDLFPLLYFFIQLIQGTIRNDEDDLSDSEDSIYSGLEEEEDTDSEEEFEEAESGEEAQVFIFNYFTNISKIIISVFC